jgi:hypothetical protein
VIVRIVWVLVPEVGVEPTRRLAASSDFKSDASADFATPA